MPNPIKVNIVYPTDPFASVPGGTDTCIRDLLAYAPSDVAMSITGVTVDSASRPVNELTICELNGREVGCRPVMKVTDLRQQQRIPLSLQFTGSLCRDLHSNYKNFDILQYHRIEPMLASPFDRHPTVLFVHQNMDVIRHRRSDIRWKYMPGLYEWLERKCVRKVSQLYCVRDDAVQAYKQRFPEIANHIEFLPTWMDPITFYPIKNEIKGGERSYLYSAAGLSWPVENRQLVFVGRLDHQKNPLLLLEAFSIARKAIGDLRLVIIGDGVLRQKVESAIQELGLRDVVAMLGVKPRKDVARWLRCSDMKVLSSEYEGMPRCVVEALGSGLPTVSTNVGEVPRLIRNGINGLIVNVADANALADGIKSALSLCTPDIAEACVSSVQRFTPEVVLGPVYERYRQLADLLRRSA